MTSFEEETTDDADNDPFCAREIPVGSTLEAMCMFYGLKYFEEAQRSGDLYGFYDNLRKIVIAEFVSYKAAHDSVNNFLIDRYVFYDRHCELASKRDSATLAIRDTLQYLSLLKNDFPLRSPRMSDDW